MMEENEVQRSGGASALPVTNNPVDEKPDMVVEEVTEDKKDIEETGRGVEEEEGEEEEEEEEEEDVEETESDEDTDDEQDNKFDSENVLDVEVSLQKKHNGSPISGADNSKPMHPDDVTACPIDSDMPVSAPIKNNAETNHKPSLNDENEYIRPDTEEGNNTKTNAYDSFKDRRFGEETMSKRRSSSKAEHPELNNETRMKEGFMDDDGRNSSDTFRFDSDASGGGESGTEEEQVAFVKELDKFHKERRLDFRPPKFYGGPLNLLKLWRAVVKLGGYDKVTACKDWRQVGESFNPPKTCTTISWTFRIFYEKALLDYERYRSNIDGSSIPSSFAVTEGAENQASSSGRARRESAARAMQGWHSQRILDNGEVSDPIVKDKSPISLTKKEKQLKNLGIPKRKKPSTDLAIKSTRTKLPKTQTETTVIDIGSPADWVKINVRETKDCYEVYALVPGLLREEVRVQSDPAGRLVISGEPENPDNPWSVTPFKKVVSLPTRIDPHQTSAVVTLHGQLFVRVPFEYYD